DEALALGAARHVFRPGDWVLDAVFSPDGRTLFASVRDGAIRAYDLGAGTSREAGRVPMAAEALALSPARATLVPGTGTGGVLAAAVRSSGTRKVLVEGGRPVKAIQFVGDRLVLELEGMMAILGLDGTLDRVHIEPALRTAIARDDTSRR